MRKGFLLATGGYFHAESKLVAVAQTTGRRGENDKRIRIKEFAAPVSCLVSAA
jgi:hypothetical protein